MLRDPLRLWVSRHIHPLVFLGAYFVTTVAGNLIFASPWGRQSLVASHSSDRFLAYPNTFTFGFWLLLLCPFVLSPLIIMATKRAAAPWAGRVARILPEFGRIDYAVITAACFGFVIYRFWLADVATVFASGVDFTSSVEARFTIRERIGYITLAPLQALLPFLTLYALIRWIYSGELFWMAFTFADTIVLSVLLIMINMKWPVLLFYIGIVLAIFVYARRHPYLKTAAGAVFVFVAFLVISAFVFRIAPEPDTTHSGSRAAAGEAAGHRAATGRTLAGRTASEQFVETTKAAPAYVPSLLVLALNRMAISYPYYYQVFTEEGAVCGGILAQARRNPYCRPSEVIYARIFVNDGFENRGTSGQAVHITGYALGGWPVAMFALIAGSIILGLFAALPLDLGPASGTVTIVGALTAYHLSQIPGEGIFLYEHGLIWPGLLILGYMFWRRGASALGQTGARPSDHPHPSRHRA